MKVLKLKINSCGDCPYCLFGESVGDSWNCEHPKSEVGPIADLEDFSKQLPVPEKCPLPEGEEVSYKIIRLSEDYGMAIIVSPVDAEPWSKDNKYWLMNDNVKEFETFKEAGVNTALGYFGGIADGMGWAPIPKTIFEEIKDVEKWVLENKTKFYEERWKKILKENPNAEKELEEFLEELKSKN